MVAQRVLIIHEGALVAEDTPANLAVRLRASERLELEVRGPAIEVTNALRKVNGVAEVRRTGSGDLCTYTVDTRPGADPRQELAAAIVKNGWALLKMNPLSMGLEEIFLRLTAREEEG
jgi:ABC-2 type transport system ATP-binding protein